MAAHTCRILGSPLPACGRAIAFEETEATCPARGAARRPATAEACAKICGALHRRRGTPVRSRASHWGPGSAAHRNAISGREREAALRCAAPGTRCPLPSYGIALPLVGEVE